MRAVTAGLQTALRPAPCPAPHALSRALTAARRRVVGPGADHLLDWVAIDCELLLACPITQRGLDVHERLLVDRHNLGGKGRPSWTTDLGLPRAAVSSQFPASPGAPLNPRRPLLPRPALLATAPLWSFFRSPGVQDTPTISIICLQPRGMGAGGSEKTAGTLDPSLGHFSSSLGLDVIPSSRGAADVPCMPAIFPG